MELTHCPLDGVQLEAEICSGGSVLVTCPRCDAEWEWHGAWVRRVRGPRRDMVAAGRVEQPLNADR
ncbi:MAG TPA: hypothetical protein VEZ15_16115 [Acidimicrobiia bacterium]|nr:hypothetical protein [Acidimicrobiia bacterium]